ncbi:MAG: sulfite exporter TauE/SafE family protein [Oscillospiraceae bacterium]|nr:sulfite exporter TauE/SafE family protein [Oscillospiraceae bacterium]
MEYLIVFIGCIFGSSLNMVVGFGFGIFCMMFFPYVIGSTLGSAAVINMVTAVQATIATIHYRRHVNWRLLITPLAAYFVVSWIVVHFAAGLNNDILKLMLGVLLIALSIYFIFIAKRVRIKANARNGILAGSLGGVMSGLFAIGGPPVSLYFSSATEEKEDYLATIQGYFMISNAYVVVLRFTSGVVTGHILLCAAVGLAGMLLGSLLGNTIFKKINSDTMRKAIYAMMAVSGAVMLIT